MEISEELLCLFSADIDDQDRSYTVTIPEQEITNGDVEGNGVYQVALLGPAPTSTSDTARDAGRPQTESNPAPPVGVGDERTVEIEAIGRQGDGIARVERGYVIIVPETEEGDRVAIEITDVSQTVAFGDVIERIPDDG